MKKIIISLVSVILILSAVLFINYEKEKNTFVKDVGFCLNTVIEQKWFGKNAQKTTDEIKRELTEFENKLSSYIETSEISVINSMAGVEPVRITEETYNILKNAQKLSEDSNGNFDITVFPLTSLWNITGEEHHIPSDEEIKDAMKLIGAEKLILSENNGEFSAFLPEKGMGIDLGGIAKGIAADMVQNIAEKNGTSGYASLGGNLSVRGKKPDKSEFKFGLRNPRGTVNEFIGIVELDGLTMATTGDYERFFIKDGVRYHHILDLSTGRPTEKGLISATVISKNGMLADYLSTVVFNDGLSGLGKYLKSKEFSVIAVDEDFNIYISDNYKTKFVFQDASGKFALKDYEMQ